MPKSKSLGERFIRQEGGGGGTKKVSKVYSSGTDPYQEGGARVRIVKRTRGRRANDLDLTGLTDPRLGRRRNVGEPMIGTRAEHLARIRPDVEELRRFTHPKTTDLGETLINTKHWRNSERKTTRYYTHATGWYLHGPNAGEPRPGRKAAMIRAYTIAALNDFKHPGRRRSKDFINLFRELREDLLGRQYKPRKKKEIMLKVKNY